MEFTDDIATDDIMKAVSFEKANEPKAAVKIYEVLLKHRPSNERILTRLIINYRKIKDYKKELKYINALIKVHESFYAPKKRKGASIISISEKINRSLGVTDKKGNRIYTDDTIRKLEKRKLLVEKKL